MGTARTALFNWLFARQNDGTFVLRIEDTDTARNRDEHVEGIQSAMRWLGLDWDEGPYFQSQRGALYAEAIEKLLAAGAAYACDCLPDQVKARSEQRGGPPGYDGYCRDRGLDASPGRLIRFRTPDSGETSFDDVVRGRVTFDNAVIEDFGIRKSNGGPTFYLANTVDDSDMRITHVIRGEDHVSNTPKYVLLWDALGFGERPVFAHLPLLYNDARKKLSKRRDKVAVEDYRDEGYLPEAMRNYLALLGWSPSGDREILTVEEMIVEFRLEEVKSAGAIFDQQKLRAINADYLRAMSPSEMVDRAEAWQRERWSAIAPLVQERARTLSEVYAMTDFLYLPEPVTDVDEWNKAVSKQPAFAAVLTAAQSRYAEIEWTAEDIHQATLAAGEAAGVTKPRDAQAPIRLAVMGRPVGPPLWESLELLGRDRTIERIRSALGRLSASG